jgi:hypothetical protein
VRLFDLDAHLCGFVLCEFSYLSLLFAVVSEVVCREI